MKLKFTEFLEAIKEMEPESVALIESISKAATVIMEAEMWVDFAPINGKTPVPGTEIPAIDAATKDKKSIIVAIIQNFISRIQFDKVNDDLVKLVLFNTNTKAKVNGQLVDYSKHKLWNIIKEELSNKLQNDPKYASMKRRFDNKVAADAKSVVNLAPTTDLKDITKIVKQQDAAKKATSVGMQHIPDIVKQRTAADDEYKSMKMADLEQMMRKRVNDEEALKLARLAKRDEDFKKFLEKEFA